MTGARLVATSCITFVVFPLIAAGQARPEKAAGGDANSFAPTVSVRELKIPAKARDAYNKGTQRLTQKDWAGSIPEFQRAIAAYHNFYEAYYKIGIADLELKLSGDAEAAFRKSVELSEGRMAAPLFGLGLTLGNAKQFDDALGYIRAGLQLEPTNATGHFTLAWVLFGAARVVEAEQSAKQAVLYNSNFAMAHLLLAQIDRRLNNSAGMVDELDAYLRIEPDSPRSPGVRAVRDAAARALSQQQGEETVAASDGQR
jgi:tetratricopeptide (TPR) repeat protein